MIRNIILEKSYIKYGKEMTWLERLGLISKFVMSQPGLQTIAIHILLNISQSKDNMAIKFGQLIEYNLFSSKIMQKMRQGNYFPTSFYFSKKLNMR